MAHMKRGAEGTGDREWLCGGSYPSGAVTEGGTLAEAFELPYPFTIGQNYLSKKLGAKETSSRWRRSTLPPEEVNMLALVSTEVAIGVIETARWWER